MLNDLPSLAQLLQRFQQVPYLASKNIYRVAAHFLHMKEQELEQFCAALLRAKHNLVLCETCFSWREKEGSCSLCSSIKRDQHIVCVVESWQELMAIEKTGGYNGVYHVLGGVVCPLEGIGPEDLTINSLINRINTFKVKEIIFALDQTPEGEATAAFIASKLRQSSVVISCLARGLPVGSLLETMDRLTVYKALSERRPF